MNPNASTSVAELYVDHHHWLVGWLCRRLNCSHHANDLAHDTFVRVLHRPQELASVQEPRAWLTTIANGIYVDHLRRRDVERAYLAAIATLPEPEIPCPETQTRLLETLTRLDALLDGLKPKTRAILLHAKLDGMTYPEIATHLQISLSTVEKHMATALRHCLHMTGQV